MPPYFVYPGSEDESSSSEEDITEQSENETEDEESDSTDLYSDVEDDADLRSQLKDCLDDVQHEGSFSAFSRHASFPNPGLYVKKLGVVGLPLSGRDAKAIAALCKQSPFGRGGETFVDKSVRKTWELEASQFYCSNPAWKSFETTLVTQAITDIGVQFSASAQSYKLLLYEKGAFFKAHRDTEKIPGMFGTLVVCLPSEHVGGEVHLKHGQKQKVLRTAESSAHELSALAWYSDVEHEIKPVTSGYRLVLTYNLVQDKTAPKQTAATQNADHEKLARLMRAWNHGFDYQDHFVYPLHHKYTEKSLCQRSLKAEDAAKGRYLDEVCAQEGVYWFLGHTVKQKKENDYGRGDEEDSDDDDHSFKWTTLPNGSQIQLGLSYVGEDELLVDPDRYEYEADSEDEGSYTGNENMPATLRYHDSVIVLMLKEAVSKRFKNAELHSAESLLSYFKLLCSDQYDDMERRHREVRVILEKAVGLLQTAWKEHSHRTYYSTFERKEQEWKITSYIEAFERVANYCYTNDISNVVGETIRNAMGDENWTSSNGLVTLVANQVAFELESGNADAWTKWLSTDLPTVCTYTYANQQRLAYARVGLTLPDSSIPSFKQWEVTRIEEIIRAVDVFSKEDVEAIIELIPNIRPSIYFEHVIPTLAEKPDAAGTSKFLAILSTISAVPRDGVIRPTFERLGSSAMGVLKLPVEDVTFSPPYSYGQEPEKRLWEQLLEIVDCYMDLGLREQGAQLLAHSLPDMPEATSNVWEKWKPLFRFLEELAALLIRRVGVDQLTDVRSFISRILHSTAAYAAKSRPRQPKNWAQGDHFEDRPSTHHNSRYGPWSHGSHQSPSSGASRCTCAPCKALQAFLEDPSERVGRFSYNKDIRSHLEYKLNGDEFQFDLDKKKSPHTLVLTKTRNRFEKELAEWKSTISQLRTALENLDSLLQPLDMSATKDADLDAQLAAAGASKGVTQHDRSLEPASASAQNVAPPRRVAGRKRKSNVIDLTED